MCVTQCPDLYKYSVENGLFVCAYTYTAKRNFIYTYACKLLLSMGKHHGALVPLSTSFINKETLPLFNVPKDVKRIFSELAKFYFVFSQFRYVFCLRARAHATNSLTG